MKAPSSNGVPPNSTEGKNKSYFQWWMRVFFFFIFGAFFFCLGSIWDLNQVVCFA